MVQNLTLNLLSFQWMAVVLQALISFGLSILVARSLEPELFGVYAIATSAGVFVTIFLEGGFNSLLQRESARSTISERFGANLPAYALGYALMAAAVMLGLIIVNPFDQDRKTLFSIVCAYLPLVLVHFSMFVLRGQGRLVKDALLQILIRSSTAMAVLVTLMYGFNTPASILFAQGVGSTLIYCVLLKKARVVPKFLLPYSIIRVAGTMMLLAWVSAIASRADLLICRMLDVSRGDIGNYGVALRLVEAAQVFAAPIGFLLLRKFRINEMGKSIRLGSVVQYMLLGLLIGLLFFLGSLVLADFLITNLFGNLYEAAADMLKVLSGGLIFFFGNIVLHQALIALELERWTTKGMLPIAMGNVFFNFAFIPIYGVMASAWIALATQMLLMIWLSLGLRNSLQEQSI